MLGAAAMEMQPERNAEGVWVGDTVAQSCWNVTSASRLRRGTGASPVDLSRAHKSPVFCERDPCPGAFQSDPKGRGRCSVYVSVAVHV